eukprot:3457920-Rhodomonas_salina.2
MIWAVLTRMLVPGLGYDDGPVLSRNGTTVHGPHVLHPRRSSPPVLPNGYAMRCPVLRSRMLLQARGAVFPRYARVATYERATQYPVLRCVCRLAVYALATQRPVLTQRMIVVQYCTDPANPTISLRPMRCPVLT